MLPPFVYMRLIYISYIPNSKLGYVPYITPPETFFQKKIQPSSIIITKAC